MLPKALICLSTYNGEPFLEDLLVSLVSQHYSNWTCVVRDDGSNDGTWDILSEYLNKYPRHFSLLSDREHVGWKESFKRLLDTAITEVKDADYVFFCDQDDIWFPNKIEKMISTAEEKDNCFLFSDLLVIDEKGEKRYPSFFSLNAFSPERLTITSLCAHNPIPGMSMAVSYKLLTKILPIPKGVAFDWWVAVVSLLIGEVLCVPDQLAGYRVYGGNQVGVRSPYKAICYYARRMKLAKKLVAESVEICENLYHRFSDSLPSDLRYALQRFLSSRGIKRKIFSIKYNFLPQHWIRKLGYIMLVE